jgi:hypothetical protein
MDSRRKPLAKVEGRQRMRQSGITISWRGTPGLDDWVAYIPNGGTTTSILARDVSEKKVRALVARAQSLSRTQIRKMAKA